MAFFQPKDKASETYMSEPHPEYSPKFLGALEQIAANRVILEQIPELTGSPLLDACTAIDKQQKGILSSSSENPRTLLDVSGAKNLFSTIWDKHYKLIIKSASNPTALAFVREGVKVIERIFVNGKKKPADFFNHMLDTENFRSLKNEKVNQNCIARIGGTHYMRLDLPPNIKPENREDHTHEHLEKLQLDTAQIFINYLLNQKDYAGHSPKPIPMPDQDYATRTRKNARQILEFLRDSDRGWEQFAPPTLAAKIKNSIKIPADLDKPLPYGTHDYNLIQDQNGKEIFHDPQLIFDSVTNAIKSDNFLIQQYSISGDKYRETTLKNFFHPPTNKIFSEMFYSDTNEWKAFPSLENLNELPQSIIAVSLNYKRDSKTYEAAREKIMSHRANHGRVNTHIHIDIDKVDHDIVYLFPGHRHKDGQANKADADAIGQIHGITTPAHLKETITINPSYANTDSKVDAVLAKLEQELSLSDVEISINFNAEKIDEYVEIINNHLIDPVSKKIEAALAGNPHIKEIIKILNPKLSRHTLLGLIMELDASTANCVFPYQKYARLALSIFPNISATIKRFLSPNYDPTARDITEITGAIRLALIDQSLSRLGLSPLGALGVYTAGEVMGVDGKVLAQGAANIQAPEAKTKTDIIFQLSELGSGLASRFTSAKSRFNGKTTNGLSLFNHSIVARLDLTDPTLLNIINVDVFHLRNSANNVQVMQAFKKIIPRAAQLHFTNRVNQWENFGGKLARSLEFGTTS